jgi:hypothetical protein
MYLAYCMLRLEREVQRAKIQLRLALEENQNLKWMAARKKGNH